MSEKSGVHPKQVTILQEPFTYIYMYFLFVFLIECFKSFLFSLIKHFYKGVFLLQQACSFVSLTCLVSVSFVPAIWNISQSTKACMTNKDMQCWTQAWKPKSPFSQKLQNVLIYTCDRDVSCTCDVLPRQNRPLVFYVRWSADCVSVTFVGFTVAADIHHLACFVADSQRSDAIKPCLGSSSPMSF